MHANTGYRAPRVAPEKADFRPALALRPLPGSIGRTMATKRKALSKRTRFEVFKRDGFKCMYCGAHPPGVLLHVDHVKPLAEGGTDDEDNLVTACENCNLGKGAVSLSAVPTPLAEKAAQVAEREEQLRGYHEVLEGKRARLEEQAWQVLDVLSPGMQNCPHDWFNSVRNFIDKLGFHEVLDAMEIAKGAPVYGEKRQFRYFCGVCWHKIREQ